MGQYEYEGEPDPAAFHGPYPLTYRVAPSYGEYWQETTERKLPVPLLQMATAALALYLACEQLCGVAAAGLALTATRPPAIATPATADMVIRRSFMFLPVFQNSCGKITPALDWRNSISRCRSRTST
ncbi:hypothetical protein COO58_03120 [Micromonospora sp. WMMA1996]|nr:hypothetical protein COO58_03120 [Micromonospora sp. WMMA1996]